MTATTMIFIISFEFKMDVEEEDGGGGSHDLPLNLAKNLDSRRKPPVFLSAAIKEKKKKDQD